VAWAEDRPRAIARMRRALSEYRVAGIRTTVPFFTWLLAQEAFVDGRVHTAYLDELLRTRNGQPFIEPTPEDEDVAAIAAAMHLTLPVSAPVATPATDGSRWRAEARREGLRAGRGRHGNGRRG